jgi:hypothetical protein
VTTGQHELELARARLTEDLDGAAVFPPGMLPAALWPYRDAQRLRSTFPLFFGPPGAGGEPALCLPAGELLSRAARAAGAGAGLIEALPQIERALTAVVAGAGRRSSGDERSGGDASAALAEAGAQASRAA